MIGMLATKYQRCDFFLGRMSLFGRFGTLWPSGIAPDGLGITFGKPGSGKSTAAAMPAMALHAGALLCFDPKGELAKACYAVRGAGGNGVKGRGDATFVVDPANLTGLPKSHYNPLQEIAQEVSTDDALRLMFKLAEGIVRNPGGDGTNAWIYTGARDFAYGLIAFVVENYPPELCNLVTLRRLLMDGDRARYDAAKAAKVPGVEKLTPFDALLLRMTEESGERFGHVIAGQAADIQKMGDRQRGSILKTLSEATMWLDLSSFQETVSSCDFLLRDFRTERISVFVCLPLNELTGIASGFMRFFLTMFMQTMYRAPVVMGKDGVMLTAKPSKPVLCLVDEFPQFGKIEDFCKIGPTMRDYGVKLWVLLQDLNQAVLTYGREETSTFLGCAAFVQIMAMTHLETIDWVVRSLGERLVKERQPDGRTVTRPVALLDLEQARRYLTARDGNQIVLRFHDRPLRLKTAPYFWYLPYWRYTPDPRHPEPMLRAWARRHAVRRAAKAGQGGSRKEGRP